MKLPTISQMVDENTIGYWLFDGNTNDYAGGVGKWYVNASSTLATNTYIHCIYDDIIDRVVLYTTSSRMYNSIGSQIASNINSTIDFIFRPIKTPNNYNTFITFRYSNSNKSDEKIWMYKNDNTLRFNQSNADNEENIYRSDNLIDGLWHHMAITIENNSLFKIYLDGKFILSGTHDISFVSHIGFSLSCILYESNNTRPLIHLTNYRVSKGLRWTDDFVGQTPIDDARYTIKEYNNEVYGIKR